jgi:hypothetical protein
MGTKLMRLYVVEKTHLELLGEGLDYLIQSGPTLSWGELIATIKSCKEHHTKVGRSELSEDDA